MSPKLLVISMLTRRGWPSKNLVSSVKESLLDSYRTANECRAHYRETGSPEI
jgi:hypothetical protein